MINRRFALLGITGTVGISLSALDAALWDAVGQTTGPPLVVLLGRQRRAILAYDSLGLGVKAPKEVAAEAEALRAGGLDAIWPHRLVRAEGCCIILGMPP